MFTGIVQGVGRVTKIESGDEVTMLVVDLPERQGDTSRLAVGASVALDGVCLTATSVDSHSATFDLIQETLQRTTLGTLKIGSKLNVERAMRYGDEVGGHIVSGHIFGTGVIESVDYTGTIADYFIRAPSEVAAFIIEKGFIAIDGISLTVGKTDQNGGFALHIIPETLRLTTLGEKGEGGSVNIEIDSMTQAVVESVQRYMRGAEESA